MKHGPNVNRLIIERLSYLAIPEDGGLADAIRLFTEEGRLLAVYKQAIQDVEHCLAVAKTANPNPYGNDDEAIAAEILRRIQERKDARRDASSNHPSPGDAPL
jgi:hypothetical protein